MVGLPKWIQIKNGFLNPRTKQDNSRSKLNTQNPPGWQEAAAPAQKKNGRKTMDPSITGECGGLERWFIDKIMQIVHLKLLFCHLKVKYHKNFRRVKNILALLYMWKFIKTSPLLGQLTVIRKPNAGHTIVMRGVISLSPRANHKKHSVQWGQHTKLWFEYCNLYFRLYAKHERFSHWYLIHKSNKSFMSIYFFDSVDYVR